MPQTPEQRASGWAPQATTASIRAEKAAGTRCASCGFVFTANDPAVDTPEGWMHRRTCAVTSGWAEPLPTPEPQFTKFDLFA